MALHAIQDPFVELDDPDRTFVRPNPGGRATPPRPPMAAAASAEEARETATGAATAIETAEVGLNRLVAVANPLLLLVPQLRATHRVDDPAALRNALAQGVRDFALRAATAGIAADRVMAARYILCTMLDEAAADTPWGGSNVWARHSLLAMFHNEVEGGEKVFQLMARLAEKPEANLDLLELIYCAVALGFEGRYRVVDNGRAQLEAVRDKLARIVRSQRGDPPRALAEHWQTHAVAATRAVGWLPLAATAATCLVALIGLYLTLLFSLDARSDPVYAQVQGLRLAPPVVAMAQPAPVPRLSQFLQADIKSHAVGVRDEVDRSVVTIRGDGAFAPGSATLLPEREALMGRIADALARVGGNVLVTGHTDSQPVARSARYPSNWHLSEARAQSVRDLIVLHRVPAERVRAEGRADAEPAASNDTPANRALNRRVEVTLFAGRGFDAPSATASPAAAASAVPLPAAARRTSR